MKTASLTEKTETLRHQFHEEIDRMEPGRLVFLQQVLRELELTQLASTLDRDFDSDRAAGKLNQDGVQAAIHGVRNRYPYNSIP